MRKGVWLLITIMLLLTSTVNANLISLDQCGNTKITEETKGKTTSMTMENDCLSITFDPENYDSKTTVYDKINDRTFRMMIEGIEERNNQNQEKTETLLEQKELKAIKKEKDSSSKNIKQVSYEQPNIKIGYEIRSNQFKMVGEITNWNYEYTDSDLWMNIRFQKNEGDILEWIPVIVDGIEQPIITETNTKGVNNYISQKLGRGNEIIIDPIYTVDATPFPATIYRNGEDTEATYDSYATSQDITTIMSDNNTGTSASMNHDPSSSSSDHVIRVKYNVSYVNGVDYFLRVYRPFSTSHEQVVYPHINDTHINMSSNSSLSISGTGWKNIPITEQARISYENTGIMDFRLSVLTSNQVTVSEVWLRESVNDTTPPVITGCHFINDTIGCYQEIIFVCNITDDSDVDNATGVLSEPSGDETIIGVQNDSQWYFSETITTNGSHVGTMVNVTACDIYNQCTTETVDVNYTYDCENTCLESWTLDYVDQEDCQTDNTIELQKVYTDNNSCGTYDELPVDNGSIQEYYCNYCDSDWIDVGSDCYANNTRYVEYTDVNSCYSQTGLLEDSPPYDDQTFVACEYLTQDFACSISEEPYIKNKIEYTCTITNGDYECINYISYGLDDILQVNPQKTERTQGGLINVDDILESRESFTTTNGLLNAYYTNKNLVAETSFVLTTICNNDSSSLTNQKLITPKIKNIDSTAPALIWAKDNATYIVVILLLLIVVSLIIGSLLSNARGKYG